MKNQFYSRFYSFKVYEHKVEKPIAKFKSRWQAENYINLLHEQQKTWKNKNTYRLVIKNKTVVTL